MLSRQVPWKISDALLGLLAISALSFLTGSAVIPLLTDAASGIGKQFFIGAMVQTTLIFLVLYYYLTLKYAVTFRAVGFRSAPFWRTLWLSAGWGVGIFLAVVLSGIVVDRLVPGDPGMQPFAQLVLTAETKMDLLLPLFLAVIIAPLGEEAFFRGFLYPAFKQRFGLLGGILLAGLIFGGMHFDLLRLVPLSVGGMGLAWLYHRAGTIYAPMIAHGIWNGIMVLMLYAASGVI